MIVPFMKKQTKANGKKTRYETEKHTCRCRRRRHVGDKSIEISSGQKGKNFHKEFGYQNAKEDIPPFLLRKVDFCDSIIYENET